MTQLGSTHRSNTCKQEHKKSRILQIKCSPGRAVTQRLDAGFPLRWPGFAYEQHVGFVVDKAALGQVFS
jgi:hypothetical protein